MELVSLKAFRVQLQTLMTSSTARPFVCDGSPLECKVFIVGFNPATELESSFWDFWDDERGFSKSRFMDEYLETRELKGVRPRIEKIVAELSPMTCLETNICSVPTKRETYLPANSRTTAVFDFLLDAIKPGIIYLHSKKPIEHFQRLLPDGVVLQAEEPLWTDIGGRETILYATPAPLYTVSYAHAKEVGENLVYLLAECLAT